MTAPTSLLDFVLNLLKDPQARLEFRASPEHMLAANGLSDVCAADIHETLPLVTDNRSVELIGNGHLAPPPIEPAPGESSTHAAIDYLRHITDIYTYDVHAEEPAHVNIWAVGDATEGLDDPHPGPGHPDLHRVSEAGHWDGGGRGQGEPSSSGHGSGYGYGYGYGYGDHTNRQLFGDHPSGAAQGVAGNAAGGPPPGSSGGDAFRPFGHGQEADHLHSFGVGAGPSGAEQGAPTPSTGGVGDWGHSSSFDAATDPTGDRPATPDDGGHPYNAPGSLGGSYGYDHQGGEHDYWDGHDDHGYGMHLDLH